MTHLLVCTSCVELSPRGSGTSLGTRETWRASVASRGFSVGEGRLPTERGWFVGCPSDSVGSMQRGMKRTMMIEKIKDWACILRRLRKTGFLWGSS